MYDRSHGLLSPRQSFTVIRDIFLVYVRVVLSTTKDGSRPDPFGCSPRTSMYGNDIEEADRDYRGA